MSQNFLRYFCIPTAMAQINAHRIPRKVQAVILSMIHPEYQSLAYADSHGRQMKICGRRQGRLLERDPDFM